MSSDNKGASVETGTASDACKRSVLFIGGLADGSAAPIQKAYAGWSPVTCQAPATITVSVSRSNMCRIGPSIVEIV